MYEIGLVSTPYSPVIQIVGPYKDRQSASEASEEYNKTARINGYTWMWAKIGEISKAPGCLISESY